MAKTVFFICTGCGFKNAPHPFKKDPKSCEQCGANLELGVDYTPGS